MTIAGHNRSIFAQDSVSDMAMDSFLENVKNRLSKYDTSLDTVFRLEFPKQDVLYVYFGNFLVKLLQILVQSPPVSTQVHFCSSSIRQHALQSY